MRAEVARFAPDDVAGYDRFMAHSRAVCRIGFEQLGHVPFGSVGSMLKIAPDLCACPATARSMPWWRASSATSGCAPCSASTRS